MCFAVNIFRFQNVSLPCLGNAALIIPNYGKFRLAQRRELGEREVLIPICVKSTIILPDVRCGYFDKIRPIFGRAVF